MRNHRFVVILAFVVGVAAGVGASAWAQVTRAAASPASGESFTITTDTAGNVLSSTRTEPTTLSNEALGLRVVGRHHGRLVGTLVAKVGNEWVEVQFAPQDALASR